MAQPLAHGTVYVNLFVASQAEVHLGGSTVTLTRQTGGVADSKQLFSRHGFSVDT